MAEQFRFNIKNVKYALSGGSPIDLGGADSIALESTYSEQVIYADGEVYLTVPSDRGLTGTLTMVVVDTAYEQAMGRLVADLNTGAFIKIQARSQVVHSIYFETDGIGQAGEPITIKTWLLGVTSSVPGEGYNQTTDSINPNNIVIPLTIRGVPLLGASGETVINGVEYKCYQASSHPGQTGYEAFGDSVPEPATDDLA